MGDSLKKIIQAFKEIEEGRGAKWDKLIAEAKNHYRIAMVKIELKPGLPPLELVTPETITGVNRSLELSVKGLGEISRTLN